MKQLVNQVYKPLFTSNKRYKILLGGRGAGRSTVASQYANAMLVGEQYFRCAIMRYVLGDIRNSIYREILDRAEENDILDKLHINDSTMSLDYGQNSINAVGFRKSSSDQKSKLKSLANYNCIIIEEADEISEEDFLQLDDSLRTVKGDITIILLLNPPQKSHWIVQRWFDLLPCEQEGFYQPQLKAGVDNVCFINTNYLDNAGNLSEQSLYNYAQYKHTKPSHYWNMIAGYIPETVVGKIYNGWNVIDELPHEARLVRHWLDFGYTNDPTAIGSVYEYNGGYILDEHAYTKGLSNSNIAAILNALPRALTIADSAEPKSIDEIKSHGVLILPAVKGKDSINQGIQIVQDQKISVTKTSTNLIHEYENYSWRKDKEKLTINVPEDKFNHHLDGVRYVFNDLKRKTDIAPIAHYAKHTAYGNRSPIKGNMMRQY